MAVSNKRLRALVGRQREITEKGNVYGEKISEDKFNEIFLPAIKDEYERYRILLTLKKDSKSVKDLAKELEIDSSIVLEHMLVLKSRGQVDFQEIIGNTPIFMKI
jgi:DNA-binding transcriptional ArsR family regulator